MPAATTRKRPHPLTFRIDDQDREALQRNAQRIGVPVATLIRRALLEAGHLR